MKTLRYKIGLLTLIAAMALSCSSQKGSASDRTGTNGATNGTGKVDKGL